MLEVETESQFIDETATLSEQRHGVLSDQDREAESARLREILMLLNLGF